MIISVDQNFESATLCSSSSYMLGQQNVYHNVLIIKTKNCVRCTCFHFNSTLAAVWIDVTSVSIKLVFLLQTKRVLTRSLDIVMCL